MATILPIEKRFSYITTFTQCNVLPRICWSSSKNQEVQPFSVRYRMKIISFPSHLFLLCLQLRGDRKSCTCIRFSSCSLITALCSLRGHSSAKTFSSGSEYPGYEFPHEVFMEEALPALLSHIKASTGGNRVLSAKNPHPSTPLPLVSL